MAQLQREIQFNTRKHEKNILGILQHVKREITDSQNGLTNERLRKILNQFPQDGNSVFSRGQLVMGYHDLVKRGLFEKDPNVLKNIRMKPMRTQSGVTPVTVLTKPFPCPGKCIFCPNDVRMPKSYLANEPGAQRAERNSFDPYLQTFNRLLAFQNIGHNTEKVELIILGGTWSFYPEYYQIWFIKRCFDAMNDFGVRDMRYEVVAKNKFENLPFPKTKNERPKTYNEVVMDVAGGRVAKFFTENEKCEWSDLEQAQKINETALCRNVGLVIETRPDFITQKEVIKIRRLGGTKVQIGIQSLDDSIMELNKRGHGRAATENAIALLRQAGFKIHAHWMANLYGSSVEKDIQDYKKLWETDIRPDELKIYPTSIIENTELNERYKRGEYAPYTQEQLLEVMCKTMPTTPRYCRLTRIIRDIPSTDIVAGNKITNFRQLAEKYMADNGIQLQDIRSREIKTSDVTDKDLGTEKITYQTKNSTEYFLSYKTKRDDKIAAFLRLSFPHEQNFIEELKGCAIIREVHVYGQVVGIGKKNHGKAQHLGLGTKLLEWAEKISQEKQFEKLAVISAIGTREYYRKRGYNDNDLYLIKSLTSKH